MQDYEFYHQQFQLFTQRSNQNISNTSKSSSTKSYTNLSKYPFTRTNSQHKMRLQTSESDNSIKKSESSFWPKRCANRFDWQNENYFRKLNHSRTRRLLKSNSSLTLSGLLEQTAEDGHGRKPSRSPSQIRLQEDARSARVLMPELFEVDTPKFCPGKRVNIRKNRSPQLPRRVRKAVTPTYLTGKNQIFLEDEESTAAPDSFRKGKKSVDTSIDKSLEKSPSNKALVGRRHSRDLKSSFSIGNPENQDENIIDEGADNHAKDINNLLTSKQKGLLKPTNLINLDTSCGSCLHDRTNSQMSTRRTTEDLCPKENTYSYASQIHKTRCYNDENDPNHPLLNAKKPLPYKFRDPFKSSLAFLS